MENIITKETETVHARRLLLYRADLDGKVPDDELLKYAEHSETTYQDVAVLRDLRETARGFEVQVEWDGLPDVPDLTWEPLHQIAEDVSDMLEQFLDSPGRRRLKEKAKSALQYN